MSLLHTSFRRAAQRSCVWCRSHSTSPSELYEEKVQSGLLRADDFQRSVVSKLSRLHSELKNYNPPDLPEPVTLKPSSWLDRWQAKPALHEVPTIPETVPKGMYLHGDVGCGKTMLMDLFYECIPEKFAHSKRRVHFHAFMEDVHKRKHRLSQSHQAGQDVIVPIARQISQEASILCFDEFQVLDIVDAMILKRLMESMIAYGMVCVITSNRPPDDLYKNGIQRESFLPCIDLIKERFVIQDLDSGLDYRKMPRALSKVYYHPLTPENRAEFDKLFDGLTNGEPVSTSRDLTVWGRQVRVPESTSKVARFDFKTLCGSSFSASDYLEITRNFETIFITDIPQLTLNERDRARRFILFIDAAYESRTKLFCLSDPPITEVFSDEHSPGHDPTRISDAMRQAMDDLGLSHEAASASSIFSSDEEIFAFARAVSRLHEMGTEAWAKSVAHK